MTSTLQIWEFESEPPQNPAGKLNHVTSDQAKQFYGKNYSYVQAEGKAGIEVWMQKIVSRDHGSLRIIKDLIFIRPQMTWHWRAWWSPRGCERNPFREAEKHTHTDISEGLFDMQTFNIDGF